MATAIASIGTEIFHFASNPDQYAKHAESFKVGEPQRQPSNMTRGLSSLPVAEVAEQRERACPAIALSIDRF
ncbi:MAG: hypothetical protein ACRBBT_15400 [Paracoccaceae bacterium]